MTRGNQRDLAREKNMKKQVGKQKASSDMEANKGVSLEARKARDAEIMRQKQIAKQGGADGGADAGTSK